MYNHERVIEMENVHRERPSEESFNEFFSRFLSDSTDKMAEFKDK